tara:strand:- start:2422 stop:2565 length:144 start_codon:yes stop_codon:yes gene_type:complete
MKKKTKIEVSPEKSLLINMLYHCGFNNKGIEIMAGATKDQIKKSIIK